MCPSCRAFITTDDKVCPYCDANLGLSYRQKTSDIAGFIPRDRMTTVFILLFNSVLYVAMTLYTIRLVGSESLLNFPGQVLILFGAKNPIFIAAGQWWRYITAGFLHGGLLHFAMNSWVMFSLGREVEEFFGRSRYLVIYFVSSVAGFLLSGWWSNSTSVGASAAIFGLVGAMIGLSFRSNPALAQQLRSHFGQFAIFSLVLSFMPFARIDIAAHVGGLIGGFLIGFLADRPKLGSSPVNRAWDIAAGFCVFLTLASFGIVALGLATR